MHSIKLIAAAAVATSAFVALSDAQTVRLTLFEHENYGGRSMTFVAETRGMCYNIDECFNDIATSAKWGTSSPFAEIEQVVFYEHALCQGDRYVVPPDNFWIPNVGPGMNDRISSFSTYTNGARPTSYARYHCGRRIGNVTNAESDAMPGPMAEPVSVVEPVSMVEPLSGV